MAQYNLQEQNCGGTRETSQQKTDGFAADTKERKRGAVRMAGFMFWTNFAAVFSYSEFVWMQTLCTIGLVISFATLYYWYLFRKDVTEDKSISYSWTRWTFLLLLAILSGTISWSRADHATETCNPKLLCSDCITAHKDCAWCKHKDFIGTRCSTKEDLLDLGCNDILVPNNSVSFIRNDSLRDGSERRDPIQLTPQHVKLTLRPGKTYMLDLRYRVAANLPIDMYFVLDFTITMKDRIQDLADLTNDLIAGLQEKFTRNIHIGFGSFVDKPAQPFSITTKQHLANPCVLQGETCEPAYSYIHTMRLNDDIDKFIETIRTAPTSANFDPMEGGLDAVLQAAVCPDIVGWRNKSRRVLIYISDSGFHFAGDGKLAGIDRPHDGLCHMKSHGNGGEFIYTHATTLDYPSYGHLKKVLGENKINSFFVVEEADKSMYEGLTKMIGTQAATEIMDTKGAARIVERVKVFYEALSKKLDITAEDLPRELDVIAQTDCSNERVNNTYNLKEQSIKCDDLEIGKKVYISLSITANDCPKDGSRKKSFKLVPSGLQESLLIEVDFICDCECKESQELDNEKCSQGNGTYECGVCKCKPGRSGEFCQCDNDDISTDVSIQEANCRKNNASESLCEDRGQCKCGQCICPKDYEGKYCECDNTQCYGPASSTKCTSKEQGTCNCGFCECINNYHGKNCQCPPTSNCVSPDNGEICSGSGTCECGKCACKPGYSGDVCEKCPRCENCKKCGNEEQLKCVVCLDTHMKKPNATYTACSAECSSLDVEIVAKFNRDVESCLRTVKDKCQINFIILCEDNHIYLHLAKTRVCINAPNPLLIALPLLGGIIGVGLLLLIIWKILTSFYDKIEYARFEHEIQDPKWSQTDNPIYKTPVTSNQNPVFKGTVDDE